MTGVRQEYVDALGKSVLRVVAGNSVGTAFVIKRGLALTCLHVVEKVVRSPLPDGGRREDEIGDLVVVDYEGNTIPAWVRRSWPEQPHNTAAGIQAWPDLALLELGSTGYSLPAVLLDAEISAFTDPLVLAGYPLGDAVGYQPRHYLAGYLGHRDPEGHRYVALTDDSVDPGFSGGPVLAESGFVVAYARLKRGRGANAPGGFAVPIADVLESADEVRDAFDFAGENSTYWVNVIDDATQLKKHGRDTDGRRFDLAERQVESIDIELTEDLGPARPDEGWLISTCVEPRKEYRRTVADLGGEVLEAVQQWSRRQNLSSAKEVELVGRVLHRLLLPPELLDVLQDRIRVSAVPPVVRLRVTPENSLVRIPWEFAAQMDARNQLFRIAADSRITFSRYVDRQSVDETGPPKHLRYLVVVNLLGGRSDPIASAVRIGVPSNNVTVLQDQSLQQFDTVLRQEGPWAVVHYVGAHREDYLTFRGYSGNMPSAVGLAELRDALERARCRALVLQLQNRRLLDSAEPNWLAFLQGSLQGLVLAEQAASPDHVVSLAERLHKELSSGESLERAVQLYREQIARQPPNHPDQDEPVGSLLPDRAAFGSISVTTVRGGNVRVVDAGFGSSDPMLAWTRNPGVGTDLRDEAGAASRVPGPSTDFG